jgi:type IV pilus assembly protein PilB
MLARAEVRYDMHMDVLSLLTEKGIVKAEDAAVITKEVTEDKLPLFTVLDKHGVTLESILQVESEHYSIPYRILPAEMPADEEVLAYIPEDSARHYLFTPIALEEGVLAIGIVDPDNIEAQDALQFISVKIGLPYKLYLIAESDFNRVLDEYRDLAGEVGEALTEYEGDIAAEEAQMKEKKDGGKKIEEADIKADAPVTKIVATILRYAVEGGASDIHIEPTPDKTRVRFRMDGDLHTSLELPNKVHQAVVARIKILSQMRLDEKRKPQDGRFSATVEGRRIDFRVSTFPTEYGEKVVMRILDRAKQAVTLESIGLEKNDLATVRELLSTPYGIILISGPTGSGKSTTLFAMLSEVDRETLNVVSVEDPVEYEIPGVAQSQVHPEIGYTFASGLRSILRQDPDVIMVGEIRDKETAQLAVQAALTGHLVFSTIHTNSAVGAIPRLVDMGVDPYLIAPTLIASIGQRLVRRMCEGAAKEVPISESVKVFMDKQFADMPAEFRSKLPSLDHLYKATATPNCPNGTRGRIGVFEILRMDKNLEHAVLTHPVEEEIYAVARKGGMITMREDAILKAVNAEIPFSEVNTLGGELFAEGDEVP